MHDSATRYSRALYESIGFNKREVSLVGSPVKVTDDMILGGKSPNDKTIYTADNSDTARKFLRDPLAELPQKVREEIGNIPRDKQQAMADYMRAEFIYQINKHDQSRLNAIFSPEQIKQFKTMEADAMKLYGMGRDYLVEKGLLPKHLAEDNDYTRYVTTKSSQDALRKTKGRVELKDADGRIISFNDLESANAFIMSVKAKNGTAHNYETQFASILKEKAIDYDTHRIHSPFVQIISYSNDVGNLIKNKSILDVLRDIVKTDKNSTPEQIQAANHVKSFNAEMVNQMLGIDMKQTGGWNTVVNTMAGTTRATSKAMLALRAHLVPQAIITGGGRALVERSVQGIKNLVNHRDGIDFVKKPLTPETNEILVSHGFSPLALATSDVTKAGGIIDRVAAHSSGAFVDYYVKKWVALGQMKIDMENAGIKVDTTDVNTIAKMYDDFSKNPKYKDHYLESQATIQGKMNGLGGSTWATQPAAHWVRATNIQALKGYVFGQINRFKQDVYDVFSNKTSKSQKFDAVQRQAQNLLLFGLAMQAAEKFMQSENPELGDEEARQLAYKYTSSFIGLPPLQFQETIENITSSPFFTAIGIGYNTSEALAKAVVGTEDWKIQAQQALSQIVNTIGGTRAVNLHTGRGLTDLIADKIGTVNTDRLDNYGRAKVHNDTGWKVSLFGLLPEKLTEDILSEEVKKLAEANQQDTNNDFEKILKPVISPFAHIVSQWKKPFTQLLATGEDKFDVIRAQQIHDIYKDITIDDSLNSFLKKRGINASESTQQMLTKLIYDASVKTRDTNVKGHHQYNVPGTQFISNGKFGEYMQKLEKEDSYTFTKILTGLTNLENYVQEN